MFRYTSLNHSGSPATRLRPRHFLLALGACTLLLLFTSSTHQRLASLAHSITSPHPSSTDTSGGYTPGALGRFLLSKQRKYLSYKDWKLYLDGEHGMLDRMMDLGVPMVEKQGDEVAKEAACQGWTRELDPADERWETCWRARMWRQVDEFDLPESFK
jgi:hypothetical protein